MPRRTDPACRAGVPTPAAKKTGAKLPQRKHLRRLDAVYGSSRAPLFFVTCCVRNRRKVLAVHDVANVVIDAWRTSPDIYGWLVGRYVIMPDHVHFFAAPRREESRTLSGFVESWKRWTKRTIRQAALAGFDWQAEFFDHLLRSGESYESRWDYVRANPVRAELVSAPEQWPFQGELNVLEW